MPIKSKSQYRKFKQLLSDGKIDDKTFDKWMMETGSMKDLPEKVTNLLKTAKKTPKFIRNMMSNTSRDKLKKLKKRNVKLKEGITATPVDIAGKQVVRAKPPHLSGTELPAYYRGKEIAKVKAAIPKAKKLEYDLSSIETPTYMRKAAASKQLIITNPQKRVGEIIRMIKRSNPTEKVKTLSAATNLMKRLNLPGPKVKGLL